MSKEDLTDSSIFRSFSLAAAPFDHEDADPSLALLKCRGWEITIEGHERAGFMTIHIRKGTTANGG